MVGDPVQANLDSLLAAGLITTEQHTQASKPSQPAA